MLTLKFCRKEVKFTPVSLQKMRLKYSGVTQHPSAASDSVMSLW